MSRARYKLGITDEAIAAWYVANTREVTVVQTPTVRATAAFLGTGSLDTARRALMRLEESGLITVRRKHKTGERES